MNFPEVRFWRKPRVSLRSCYMPHKRMCGATAKGSYGLPSPRQTSGSIMAQWQRDHPEDVATTRAFCMEKKVERGVARAAKRQMKAATKVEYDKGKASTLDPDSDQCLDIISTTD
jgi:hypothetical protein